jgi:hypothetical protein
MTNLTHYPVLVFALGFFTLWLSLWLGRFMRQRWRKFDKEVTEELNIIVPASLTLLGLIIAFSFSMAASRYDMRKNHEEAEANAIGTEYVRLDLLPVAEAQKVRVLLRRYLDQRIAFYVTHGDEQRRQLLARTIALQAELWSATLAPVQAQPTPVTALVLSGMNDVLNSQGYAQAGFWNRIPTAAWALMTAMAIGCSVLVGYGSRSATVRSSLLPVLPLLISIAFMFIADIDAPRHGIIVVRPENLISLANSLDEVRPATAPATDSSPKRPPMTEK